MRLESELAQFCLKNGKQQKFRLRESDDSLVIKVSTNVLQVHQLA